MNAITEMALWLVCGGTFGIALLFTTIFIFDVIDERRRQKSDDEITLSNGANVTRLGR